MPYADSLQTNILFTSISSVLNAFLILQKSLFLTFLSSNFMLFPLILILGEKNTKFFFIIIWVAMERSHILK